jgi:hypothetical protein
MTLLLSASSGAAGDLVDLEQAPPSLLKLVDSTSIPIATSTDFVLNDSSVPGGTATDALNSLQTQLSTALASLPVDLAGTGIHVASNQLTTRIRPRLVQLCDYFIGGTAVSGSIGQLAWTLLGSGTPAVARGNSFFSTATTANRITLSTSSVIGDRSCLMLGDTETRQVLRPTELGIVQALWATPLGNRRLFFGLSDNFATAPAAMVNGIGIYYDSALSPNYQLIARAASVGSPSNTGVAVPGSTAELVTMLRVADDNYQFYVGNTLIGTILAGVPDTGGMNIGFRAEALAASPATWTIGYFGLQLAATGAFDDDNFLQG